MKKVLISAAFILFSSITLTAQTSATATTSKENETHKAGGSCCQKGASARSCCSSKAVSTSASSSSASHCSGDHKTAMAQPAERRETVVPSREEPKKD
jgi:hypothetical protein